MGWKLFCVLCFAWVIGYVCRSFAQGGNYVHSWFGLVCTQFWCFCRWISLIIMWGVELHKGLVTLECGEKTSRNYSRNNPWEHLKGVKNTHKPPIRKAFVVIGLLFNLNSPFFFLLFLAFYLLFFSQAKTINNSSGGATATIAKNSSSWVNWPLSLKVWKNMEHTPPVGCCH